METLHLDATDVDAVRIVADTEGVDAIINCAAYTNVDGAESDQGLCDLLNRQLPANLASVAQERNALLVHISTDYVFGGNASVPYKEDSVPDPTGVYGATKLLGENAILSSGCRYLILRTAWLYSPYGKNFVKTMYALSLASRDAKVVNDQIGSPTSAKDLADFIVHIIENNNSDTRYLSKQGIYNFADKGQTSWYELAKCVFRKNEFVSPCSSDEYPTPVERPKYSVLDTTLTEEVFDYKIPVWTESLIRVLNELDTIEYKRKEILELENTEFSFGHNVCVKEKEEL